MLPHSCSFHSSGLALTASDLNAYVADISTDPYYCRDALDDNLRSFGNSDLSAFVPFSSDFFITVLGRIRSTSPGPEGIPFWMYRTYAVKLGPVIAKLVNFSLTPCRVPLVWKTAHITPVPKTSPVTGAGDLRPISVTSVLPRTVEKLVGRKYLTPLLCSFPADGVTLNFLGVGELLVSRPYTVVLSPDQSDGPMSHPVLTLRYYPVEKNLCLACKRPRRSVQTLTRFCFCSSINILGTQRVGSFSCPNNLIQFDTL